MQTLCTSHFIYDGYFLYHHYGIAMVMRTAEWKNQLLQGIYGNDNYFSHWDRR